ISVDAAGNAFVTGETYSSDFAGASGSNHVVNDAFVAKLSASGTLIWATYLGGSSQDNGYGISVDAAGNAFVTGRTASTNFAGASGSNHGLVDVFVAEIDELPAESLARGAAYKGWNRLDSFSYPGMPADEYTVERVFNNQADGF